MILKWIDQLPIVLLIVAAVILGLAPFKAEPHLWQKLKMLYGGSLTRPIDIFDLFLHGSASVLLIIKLARIVYLKTKSR